MVNNHDYLEALALLTSFVMSVSLPTVNAMMSKESVKNGLKQGFSVQSLPTKSCKAMTLRPQPRTHNPSNRWIRPMGET